MLLGFCLVIGLIKEHSGQTHGQDFGVWFNWKGVEAREGHKLGRGRVQLGQGLNASVGKCPDVFLFQAFAAFF